MMSSTDLQVTTDFRNSMSSQFFCVVQRISGVFESTRGNVKVTDRELYLYLIDFFNNNDELPTVEITAKHFGLAGNAIGQRFLRFEKYGWLVRNSLNNLMFPRY